MKKKGATLCRLAVTLIASFALLLGHAHCVMAQSSKQVKVLKVGSTLPLNTGMGVETKKMLEVIVSGFNESGGLTVKGQTYTVDLIIYDDKYSAEAGRAAVERLVHQDQVKFIICQISSPAIVAGSAVSEQAKVLTFAGGASPKIVAVRNRFTFGTSTTRTSIPPLWMMAQKAFPGLKTAVFLSPDDETGKARSAEEKQVAEAFGTKVLGVLYYPRDTVDFSTIAVKALSYKPDAIAYPGAVAGTQFGLQLKAIYAAGFKGAQISGITPSMEEIAAVASKEAMEGIICKLPETELSNPPPLARQVKQDYVKRYGKWSEASLSWIPGWYAFLQAVKKADTLDTEVIAAMLSTKGLDWEMPNGKAMLVKRPDLKNDKFCDTCSDQTYGQIRNGKLVYLGKLGVDESIKACEKVFGGGWR